MKDIAIQIHAVTESALAELRKKFPNSEFDLIVRDFAPSIHIQIRKTQFSELLKHTSEGFVFEEFCLDTPSAQGTMHYKNGGRMNYEKTVAFLRDLKKVPILQELWQVVRYQDLIPWMRDCEGHEAFFRKLQGKYPEIFSHLDYATTTKELTNVLMAAIERRYRSDAINYHIRERRSIEDRLAGIMDWHLHHSEAWSAQMRGYMPELSTQGFQRITVTEIVPRGLDDYWGEIGGKTVKLGTFKELNAEFVLSQRDALGDDALHAEERHLQEYRDLFLHMLVARRYLFPEAIDKILDAESRAMKLDFERLRSDEAFRTYVYWSFMTNSQLFIEKLYRTHNLLRE
jgi:hypothetical protein